ncbi:hypothetical protein ACFS27_00095 [Promicromonospora vindobonensis]|uniref:Uncharacterized protein n=1 Tax=Promicromonospora vindobonensis TaxID=195748 RepID=A0ABW5VK16_9MICO
MEAALSHQQTLVGLSTALDVVVELVDLVGAEKVAGCVVRPDNIHIQPSELQDGDEIAQRLGLHSTLDSYSSTPGFTDWCGQVKGVEVHVRSALRRTTA